METKIAVLSNVNMNFVIRTLKKEFQVYGGEGYGNELGTLLNPSSSYHTFDPKITFLVMDLCELLEHGYEKGRIQGWFQTLRTCIRPGKLYYLSDAWAYSQELSVVQDPLFKQELEMCWNRELRALCEEYSNVYVLPYHRLVEELGEENTFCLKTWYMGKILHTGEAQKRLAGLIGRKVALQERTAKKVLLLDLDNTLWGGLAGEADHTPVELSEDHAGLAYKNEQRVILKMKEQGVLLGIVSKNNEEDAMEILERHPHMVLRPEDFAVRRINWRPKQENILEIAAELNLGVDSFVFWDDNPSERELIKATLPQVSVPDFPERPEELAPAMVQIYRDYFEKPALTREDLEKTQQYAQNAERNRLQESAVSFEDYLKKLQIVVTGKDPLANAERLTQLVNKTNQFNLTTKRYEMAEMLSLLQDADKRVYLYQVSDCFGDSGIVAAVIVDLGRGAQRKMPMIDTFVMSCRVMGKQIEYAIIEDVERSLFEEGFTELAARYLPTAKNQPVAELFERLGYEVVRKGSDGEKDYRTDLAKRPERVYYAKIEHSLQTV